MDAPQAGGTVGEASGREAGAASSRGRLAKALLARAQGAELVSRFAQLIAAQLTVPGIIKVATARVRELCEAEGARLLLVDPSTGELTFAQAEGAGQELEQLRLAKTRGVVGRVARLAAPFLVVDTAECPFFDPSADERSGFRTKSVVAAPLLMGGDVLGVIEAVRSDRCAPFGPPHLERLMDFATHVAIAVHNAQITAELRRAQEGLLAANAELERKVEERTRQIARAREEWMRTIDAIADPIAVIDGFRIRRANRAYAARVGLPVTQLAGSSCHEVYAKRATPCPGCPLAAKSSGVTHGEVRVGSGCAYQVSTHRLSEEPAEPAVVVHYRDLTAQRKLEEKQREAERMAAVAQLAAGAAHEINNPLAFLTSNLNTLRQVMAEAREGLTGGGRPAVDLEAVEEGEQMLEESLEGAQRVREIVRSLGELAKPHVGSDQSCSANDSVTRVVRAVFGDRAEAVVLDLQATGPAKLAPLELDQVLTQLLKNARQAVKGAERVHVRTRRSGEEVLIEVADEGCGIAPEHLPRIFEPFFTTRGVGRGLGLGLTAAYGIVRRSGGEIEVRSEPGRGSTFVVRLPR
ncbi:MAG: GAF domain-containing protein [Myxococcales bacterium]|nr:GAF domain-containing protein [Myxococcales bacterium]